MAQMGFTGKATIKIQDGDTAAIDDFAQFAIMGSGVEHTTDGRQSILHPQGIKSAEHKGKQFNHILDYHLHASGR